MQAEPGAALALIVFFVVAMAGVLLALSALIFWIWMLVDCAKYTPDRDNLKLVWILVIAITGWVGALVYFFVQRPKNPNRTAVGQL